MWLTAESSPDGVFLMDASLMRVVAPAQRAAMTRGEGQMQ